MGKLADAIRERRQNRQRRLGFGAATEERLPSMLVGTIGIVDGADFCLAVSDEDASATASADVPLWGRRLDALTAEGVAGAKEQGASFVSFTLDAASADGVLDEDVDYVVRLHDLRIDEADARAIGSLSPAEIAVEVEFPLSLSTVLNLRRLAILAASPIGLKCPVDISPGDVQALRDSGVAVLVLGAKATAADVAALKQRIAELPERKPKRDEDARPLIPTVSAGGSSED